MNNKLSKKANSHSNKIPLSFDKAVEGLVAVKPKQLVNKPKPKAKKKPS
jgi:hypothetical protein